MDKKYIGLNSSANAMYTRGDFTGLIPDKENIKVIIEAGARDLLDSIDLENIYPNATIHSFECNPECVDVCNHNLQFTKGRVVFNNNAVTDKDGIVEFYSYDSNKSADHDGGVSSQFKHKNHESVPTNKIEVESITLNTYAHRNNIANIDMLCLDLQGGELALLKGLGNLISTVKYIIIEIDTMNYYENEPTCDEVYKFLETNGFNKIYSNNIDHLYIK